MQTLQQVAAPAEIQQIASTYKMGGIRALHGPARLRNAWLFILFLALGLLITAGGLSASNVLGLLMGIAFCVYGFVILFQGRSLHRNIKIYICEHGFIYAHANEAAQPFRWDQITKVWRKVTVVLSRYREMSRTDSTYTIERKDGYKIILGSDTLADMANLGKTISEQTSTILFPLAVQNYNQGQTVIFDRLSVNKQGLQQDQELIPWQQIEAIDTQSGTLRIKRQGTWKLSLPCPQIPNLFVFLSLTDSILKTQAKH